MADAVPGGVSPEALEAAQGTLGGALAVAEQLPDQLGVELLGTARAALAQAFELFAAIAAAIAIAAAVVTVVLLRHVRPGSESGVQPDLAPAGAVGAVVNR